MNRLFKMLLSFLVTAASIVCISALHDDRIVNGRETSIENFPHQVSLRRKGKHVCGGAILAPKYVITAAHCIYDRSPKYFTVLAGATSHLDTVQTSKTASVHNVVQIYTHAKYSKSTVDCDVGFLRLRDPIEVRPTARPISLAPVTERPKHGDIVQATGWGLTEENGEDPSDVLRVADLPVIDLNMCKDVYGNDTANLRKFLTENMFCAGGSKNSQATYKGDSGGPVINSKQQLVGLVSWGHADEPLGYPQVFTDLGSFRVRSYIEHVLDGYGY